MSETILEQLQSLLAKQTSGTGWNNPAPSVAGLAVPVKINTPKGEIRCYLSLPAESAASPDAILTALQALDSAGFPLDFWQRDSGWKKPYRKGGWA